MGPMLREVNMLRASSYNIYVDLPDNPEEMLLVHGYWGAYDKVSRRVATYVRSLEVGRPPRPLYGTWSPEPPIAGEVRPPSEYCGGGCAVLAMEHTRAFHTNYCDGFSQRFRASVAETYQDHAAGVRVEGGSERLCTA